MLINEEINKLRKEQAELIRQADCNEIDNETFAVRHIEIKDKIEEKTRQLLEQDKQEKIKLEVEQKMEEKNKPEVPKVGRKPREGSYATVIAEVLCMKSIKNLDAAVAKIDEKKPGRDKLKNANQVRAIIREAKKGKGRWAAYTWDEENFLLTPKQ